MLTNYSINQNESDEDEQEYYITSSLANEESRNDKELLQQKLRFYFMSPIDKWKVKRRFPFKLVFQLLKIIFVTIQLLNFGNEMSNFLRQDDHMKNAFRNILLDDWDKTREIIAYPPATGDYAIYTTEHFYSSIDFAIRKFSNLTQASVGSFGFEQKSYPEIIFEKLAFLNRTLDPSSFRFNIDNEQNVFETLKIKKLFPSGDPRWYDHFSTKTYFDANNFSISFDSLIKFQLVLPLRTILFEDDQTLARCFDLNITISYSNVGHDAMIKVKLQLYRTTKICQIDSMNQLLGINIILIVNYIVLMFCFISTLLCIRSLYRGQLLLKETDQYFLNVLSQKLSLNDRMEFIDIGLVMICLNDILISTGTIMKMRMDSTNSVDSHLYINCSLLLGIGNLLVWLGLLRYFSYFKSYNILIVTLKKSMPSILRFCLCAFLVYGGFCFCGWVVLGPHHLKFRTLSSTLECLFSLMNGDDMFATFFSIDVKKSSIIWWFSRLYLYLFISLSIYVIVSLFIAIILDVYETVVEFYKKKSKANFNKSPLQRFIDEYPIESLDGRFSNNSIVDQIQHFFRYCFDRQHLST